MTMELKDLITARGYLKDAYTSRAFQLERSADEEPTIEAFLDYMGKRALALENAGPGTSHGQLRQSPTEPGKAAGRLVANTAAQEPSCLYCKLKHKLHSCNNFKLINVDQRVKFVNENGLCNICLCAHTRKCRYHFKCAKCKEPHNTLLHHDTNKNISCNTQTTGSASTASLAASNNISNDVLLPTAKVKLVTRDGAEVHLKALLDSGSQLTFITQRALQLLDLEPTHSNVNVVGITNTKTRLKHCLPLEIHSLTNPFKVTATCHVVEQITCNLPQYRFSTSDIFLPKSIKLADDQFNLPAEIDLLMGADIFFQVLLPSDLPVLRERQQSATVVSRPQPQLVNTQFGYIIGAAVAEAEADSHRHKRDRTRSRSPHLASPSDGDATSNDSVAAQYAATLDDTPRGGCSGVATPRAGTSGDGKFSHILIKHNNSRRPVDNEDKPVTRTKDEALDLVIDIHEKITKNLITFADATVSFSECKSVRHEGVILSGFKSGKMEKSFQSAALALAPGKISDVVETNSGYHIIQRAESGAAAGESHRHRRHRTRSRSPRLATPSDGVAAPTDGKPRHSTRRYAVPRGGAVRDAVARDGAGRDTVAHDGAGLDGASGDRDSGDGASGDKASGDGATGDRASGDGASGNGTPNDTTPQDAKSNVKLSQILIKHTESRRPFDLGEKPVIRNKKQAMALVQSIYHRISQHRVTFADAAVRYSDCLSARDGGDIQSQFKTGKVRRSFKAIAIGLNPGQMSQIIHTNAGYHILLRRE